MCTEFLFQSYENVKLIVLMVAQLWIFWKLLNTLNGWIGMCMEYTEPRGRRRDVNAEGMCYFYQWKERKIVLVDNALMLGSFLYIDFLPFSFICSLKATILYEISVNNYRQLRNNIQIIETLLALSLRIQYIFYTQWTTLGKIVWNWKLDHVTIYF